MLIFIISILVFLLMQAGYIVLAKRFGMVDKPGYRSSHTHVTVTGAGFIFPLAFAVVLLITGEVIHYRALITGLFLLTCLSFLDDLRTLRKTSRIIVQLLAVCLLLWQTGGLFTMTIWALIPGFIFVVGIINAYNFMDGINGMTAIYSFVSIATFFFLRLNGAEQLPSEAVFFVLLASITAFGVFNVRKKALAFCGDVGSITIAFIIAFFVIRLMIRDDNGKWILLIGVYGLDSVATIILRLIRGENIGQPHRSHFYQFLAQEAGLAHISISLIYAAVQLGLNFVVIYGTDKIIITIYIAMIVIYSALRLKLEGKERLFIRYTAESREASIIRIAGKVIPQWAIFIIDLGICCIALMLSYLLRYEFDIYAFNLHDMPGNFLLLLIVNSGFFLYFRTSAGILRYTGMRDIGGVFLSQFLTTSVLIIISLLAAKASTLFYFSNVMLAAYAVISFLLLAGYRVAAKNISGYVDNYGMEKKLVIIYGAGEAGFATKKVLEDESRSNVVVCGFIDDDPKKIGKIVNGTIIYGPEMMPDLCNTNHVSQVIISAFNMSAVKKNDVVDYCIEHDIKVLHIPPVNQWINGRFSVRQLHPISIEDLLEREPIQIDQAQVERQLRGKRVLVTGAAGSIGSEIVRQVLSYKPASVILCDQAETPLHQLLLEMEETGRIAACIPYLGDIRNRERMMSLFIRYRPEIVYHAAAYKHVPIMEYNPEEAVHTNVLGTGNIINLSIEYGVDRFVMISTDKAVNPSNVMGASKRLAEIYVQYQQANHKNIKFITTRFGNVLGSNGSVLRIFKDQIEKGGPLTITHPEVTRFFMTIPEAGQLVLEAGAMGKGGEVYTFDMGNSVKISDMAHKMIRLYGLIPEKDIAIRYTGLRPGEKLYEEVISEQEELMPTHNKKLMISKPVKLDMNTLGNQFVELKNLVTVDGDPERLVAKMKEIMPEFVSSQSEYERLDRK